MLLIWLRHLESGQPAEHLFAEKWWNIQSTIVNCVSTPPISFSFQTGSLETFLVLSLKKKKKDQQGKNMKFTESLEMQEIIFMKYSI